MSLMFSTGAEKDLENIKELAREAGSEPGEVEEFLERDRILRARRDDEFRGFAAFRLENDVCMIDELGVLDGCRNEGVGKAILEEVTKRCRTEGVDKVRIETSNDNIPAIALYQKTGFRIKEVREGELVEHHGGEEKGWEGIPVRDRIILEKTIE